MYNLFLLRALAQSKQYLLFAGSILLLHKHLTKCHKRQTHSHRIHWAELRNHSVDRILVHSHTVPSSFICSTCHFQM